MHCIRVYQDRGPVCTIVGETTCCQDVVKLWQLTKTNKKFIFIDVFFLVGWLPYIDGCGLKM